MADTSSNQLGPLELIFDQILAECKKVREGSNPSFRFLYKKVKASKPEYNWADWLSEARKLHKKQKKR